MNSISEQILSSIDILVNEKVSKLEYDKTIQATIYRIDNVDTGEYKVRYNGNIFTAYAQNVEKSYKLDETVYVVIPEGNFSNRKIITGLASDQSLNTNELNGLSNQFFEVSQPLNKMYNDAYNPNSEIGVTAGAHIGETNYEAYLYEGSDTYVADDYHGVFQQYSSKYELLKIQASFMTQFYQYHTKGNYGIEVEFYTKDNTVVSYRLDFNSFNGDPYLLSVFSPQSVIIKSQKNYLLGLKSIKLFQEDFEYDQNYSKEPIVDIPNIFARDIFITFADKRDLTDTTYYLNIITPRGTSFNDTVNHLELTGQLVYQGKDLINDSKTACQWYKRDLAVMTGHDEYDRNAGPGWRAIEETQPTLYLDAIDLFHEQSYKLVAIYNNNVVVSAEQSITNSNSGYDFEIEQVAFADDVQLQLKNNLTDEELLGQWYVNYPDGAYNSINKAEKSNAISITPFLKYSTITIYCAVYNKQEQELGTLSYVVSNAEEDTDVTVTYTGDEAFRYDANGDIDVDNADQERTLQANLTWREGIAASYYITWNVKDSDGKEYRLPSSKEESYTLPDSMMQNLWVDNYNILHYNIRQKYKIDNSNNNIILKIHTINGQVYSFIKEILFLKDGDQGTNGTTYICAVRPCDNDGLKKSGFQALRYNNGWQDRMDLRCYVYKDGELINSDPNYSISYIWTGVNILVDNEERLSTNNDIINARGNADSAQHEFYVKAQATIRDNGKTVTIYTSYPIDVIVGNTSKEDISISNIPSYIQYSASGARPQFYSNSISYDYKEKTYDEGISSLDTSLIEVTEKELGIYLVPAGSFTFENIRGDNLNTVGVLDIDLPDTDDHIIHTIIMYLNTYGNEAINGWDGTALDTGEGKYVFAPQVGAGEKDSSNRFTGVVMGKDSAQDQIGLYGYQKGINTFGLMEDGKAFFGAKVGGGQILIDGTSGIIHGGDVTTSGNTIYPAANGMYLRLADKTPERTTKAIGVGWTTHQNEYGRDVTEENFYVTYDGKLKATEADIQGNIYAVKGQIGGTARSGGWTIETGRLYSGSGSSYVALDSGSDSTWAIWAGSSSPGYAPFRVSRNGYVYANNVKVKGDIEADTLTANKSGTIAGWKIDTTSLTAKNGSIGLSSAGNAAIWIGDGLSESSSSIPTTDTGYKFLVTRDGKLYCRSANIQGSVIATDGKIGNWELKDGELKSSDGTIVLSVDNGIKLGDNFTVTKDGKLTCKEANVTGTINTEDGTIAGWKVSKTEISSSNGKVKLQSSGKIITDYFETNNGDRIGTFNYQGFNTLGINSRNDMSLISTLEISISAPLISILGGSIDFDGEIIFTNLSSIRFSQHNKTLNDLIGDLQPQITNLRNQLSSLSSRVSALESKVE